jgi:hypothetical protein
MLNLKKRATDMKIMLIGMIVILFIVFLGFYPRIKRMKKRKDGRSSVEEFHNNYIERRKELQRHRDAAAKATNYVTKYNSQEDYREK